MRSLILAIQFLTRLPTPQVKDFAHEDLSRTAPWFPAVGLLVGGFVAAAMIIMSRIDAWLGALAGLIVWTWITGALHLDGLADLADALGASHRDPQRFLQVMRDPHVGTFGAVVLVIALISKLVLLYLLLSHELAYWFALPLLCAWSRLGAIAWSASLPSLHAGSGEAFAWQTSKPLMLVNAIVLLALTILLLPVLIIAPIMLWMWWWFLRYRLGGMTGDCLGAGIEATEVTMLLMV
ncbi:MAG: adenosylcobinamide-GDP ribazoletransferase, partial [Steroidobacter sp.]